MSALAAMDGLGLIFGLAILTAYLLIAVVYVLFFYGAGQAKQEERAERAETDGSWLQYADERDAAVQRDRWRHQRHGKGAA